MDDNESEGVTSFEQTVPESDNELDSMTATSAEQQTETLEVGATNNIEQVDQQQSHDVQELSVDDVIMNNSCTSEASSAMVCDDNTITEGQNHTTTTCATHDAEQGDQEQSQDVQELPELSVDDVINDILKDVVTESSNSDGVDSGSLETDSAHDNPTTEGESKPNLPTILFSPIGFVPRMCRHKRRKMRNNMYKDPLVTIKYMKLKYQRIRLRSLKHRCHFVLWKLAELQRNSKQMKIDILKTAVRIMKKMSLSVRSWQEMAEMPIPLGRRPNIEVNVRLMVNDMNQLRKRWLTKTMSGMRSWTDTLKKNSSDIKDACGKLRDYGLSEADWQCTQKMMDNTDEQIRTLEQTRIEIEEEITRSVLEDMR